ncbi:MAG: glutaredoxin family protein [Candidatus Nezhaarchaeota archaeon]|nr:glutaredoxin family protein [Candidatus Nezhaarchaeota archaeon]MCX8141848.1 glutaredoxin family protein [Candidatus Nezhaarchaeota archaeon]MDW8050371.1 glutaredoxin domain-containing protein [Nitrososphaerota archaeon]
MVKVKVYVSPRCHRCEVLKKALSDMRVEYDVMDVSDSDVMTDLIMRDIFITETPALEVGDQFFHARDIFNGDRLLIDKLREIVKLGDGSRG